MLAVLEPLLYLGRVEGEEDFVVDEFAFRGEGVGGRGAGVGAGVGAFGEEAGFAGGLERGGEVLFEGRAEGALVVGGVEEFAFAQGKGDVSDAAAAGVEGEDLGDGAAAGFDAFEIGGEVGGVAVDRAVQPGAGAEAGAELLAVAGEFPEGGGAPAAGVGAGAADEGVSAGLPVAELGGGVADEGAPVDEPVRTEAFIIADLLGDGGAIVDPQVVGGDGVGAAGGDELEVALEVLVGLPGQAVDEVDINHESVADQLGAGGEGDFAGVLAADVVEGVVVGGLDAHADAADLVSQEDLDVRVGEGIGRALDGVGDGAADDVAEEGGEGAVEQLGWQGGGGAAADIELGERSAGLDPGEFLFQGVDVADHGLARFADALGVEAEAAGVIAERDVGVEADGAADLGVVGAWRVLGFLKGRRGHGVDIRRGEGEVIEIAEGLEDFLDAGLGGEAGDGRERHGSESDCENGW